MRDVIPGARFKIRTVAIASLVFTYLFFCEYLPPLSSVYVPYDLDGYHHSLDDYAFQALAEGRFPEWDPTIYCGLGAAGNPQTALFYPPTWLMFAANAGRDRLPYRSMEIFIFAHVWLAFLLCYLWLRGRQLEDLACLLGAGVFAFSGYMCLQLQHLGLIAGYTWFPLGLMAIDQAEKRGWRPLLMLVAASAMCFLAGYPPTWVVFAVCMTCYAIFRPWRSVVVAGTLASLVASLLVAMIQILPAWELSRFMLHEDRYGAGIKDPEFYLSYLLPNYFNFGLNVPIFENFGKEYLYLGAPAVLGLVFLIRRRNPRVLLPFLAVGIACLIAVTNPFSLVWSVVRHSNLLAEVVRAWYFLAGITLAIAPLAAYGLADFLRRKASPVPAWIAWLALLLLASWSTSELVRSSRGGVSFAHGWRSVYDPAVTLALCAFALYVLRLQRGAGRLTFTVVLLLAVGIDYKAFGASKRFNAARGRPLPYTSSTLPGIDPVAYRQMRTHPEYRLLLDQTGLFSLALRHAGLTTPQGFDPFFPAQYRRLLEGVAHFRGNWQFDLDPENEDALKLLGIGYVATAEGGPMYPRLQANPAFRRVGSNDYYTKVFEYKNARPSFGWESESGDRAAAKLVWTPEYREFGVHSADGGRFTFHEQFLPGWQATVDGKDVAIERWRGAFQAVAAPPGEHVIRFRYRSRGLRLGAGISSLTLLILAGMIWGPRQGALKKSLAHRGRARQRV